jgi:hypothetical protein
MGKFLGVNKDGSFDKRTKQGKYNEAAASLGCISTGFFIVAFGSIIIGIFGLVTKEQYGIEYLVFGIFIAIIHGWIVDFIVKIKNFFS